LDRHGRTRTIGTLSVSVRVCPCPSVSVGVCPSSPQPAPRSNRPLRQGMETIRYRPGEAIRWLEIGAEDIRKSAKRQGQSLVRREGERSIGRDLRDAAGAIFDLGKSALADLVHRQAQAVEVVFEPESFVVGNSTSSKTVRYGDVKELKLRGDRLSLILGQGSVTIKPYAYIVSGRVKVPVGWSRNGLEVPYELLIDELSARCGLLVQIV
jgi:hypothetical protein